MLAIAERRARPKAERFLSSFPGRTCLFASFPSPAAAGYWATFTESLRDRSSAYSPGPLKLTRMGSCRTATRDCDRLSLARSLSDLFLETSGRNCEFNVTGPLPLLSMKVGRRGFLYLLGFAGAEINGEDEERFQVRRIMADACQRSDIDPGVWRGLVCESWPKLENVSR